MRIHFSSITIPERAAKRLKRLLDIPEAKARQWTAYVLGYANWHELHVSIGQQGQSLTDEQLSQAELSPRLWYQLQRLSKCLEEGRMAQEVVSVFGAWRPSAARPQEVQGRPRPVHNVPGRLLLLSLKQVVDDKIPISQVLAQTLLGIEDCDDLSLCALAADIAVDGLQRPAAVEKRAGRQVLEALSRKEVPVAWFNLAMALMTGDGGAVDEPRGVDLLERVADCTTAPADYRARARSLVGASLAKGLGGRHADVDQALVVLREAAEEGDSEAGFNAGLLLQQKGQMDLASKYYRMGAERGHAHAMTNLGLALLNEPHLAIHESESVEWLRKAAEQGDSHAAEVVGALDANFIREPWTRYPGKHGSAH